METSAAAIPNFVASSFRVWHVVFQADCNLRCTYCSTKFGTSGQDAPIMKRGIWEPWVAFALDHTPIGAGLEVEFGYGESFLNFDRFIQLVDYLRGKSSQRNIPIHVSVTTNGTLLDGARLRQLAERHISLTFSIDGPEALHDRCRRTRKGKGSHHTALSNWQAYRSLARKLGPPLNYTVQSVYTREHRLADLTRFWFRHNQPTFTCMVQLPGKTPTPGDIDQWRQRQEAYLTDLEAYAMEAGRRLSLASFLSEYRGPEDLYQMWWHLFLGLGTTPCRAGEEIIAVDTRGYLYPCEGFIGSPVHRIGDVIHGLDTDRLRRFQVQRLEAVAICQECADRLVCPKCCLSAFPDQELSASYGSGCGFGRRLARIARNSYRLLERA